MRNTSVYLACFRSQPGHLVGSSSHCAVVETAISRGEWPYDNGDDPSFYVARQCGGRLTWGVCRQDLRNRIREGSIVVFFSFDPSTTKISYRLCAVATVEAKLDHSAVYLDTRLRGKPYLNALIERVKEGWRHAERDRPRRHEDWLWRIADHRGITQIAFNQCHRPIYRNGYLSDGQLAAGKIRLASNYVLFSASTKETYICPRPPIVAVADGGPHETWTDRLLQRLTVLTAARYLKNGRDYLRTGNRGRPHRQIHFEMPGETASEWRRELIATLKKSRSA